MESTAVRPRRRFTVDDYHRMGELRILGANDRVELIDGQILEMPPIGSPHAGAVDYLTHVLAQGLGERAIVRVQGPIRLSGYSEPEPDIAILRSRADFYRTAHPGPEDVLLVIEVADSTSAFDRSVKLGLYARAAIPEYWIVDIARGVIEVYRSPREDTYREHRELRPGDPLSAETFPDLKLVTAEVLGLGGSRVDPQR